MEPFLAEHQKKAIFSMHDGCILNGDVGSGKSRTALYYYYLEMGGRGDPRGNRMKNPRDLYIITTARKRDTFEWDNELALYTMSRDKNAMPYNNTIVIDSWNNIAKYRSVVGAFFIFDEDRVTGSGKWVKAFLDITRKNRWIILSATPGDCWMDYWAVFVANGYFRNKTDFCNQHVIYNRFTSFPSVSDYRHERRLLQIKSEILVDMEFERPTVRHNLDIWCEFDKSSYREITKRQWNIFEDKPIESPSECCYILRKVCNSDPSRLNALYDIVGCHDRIIIFYSYDYELELLRSIKFPKRYCIAEWNGHKHDAVPDTKNWIYLVQYTAGCEGWNCITTNVIVFFSQQYSYKVLAQACGRIDRMNTPYKDLFYYHLKSHSNIDMAIAAALKNKKDFNERRWLGC